MKFTLKILRFGTILDTTQAYLDLRRHIITYRNLYYDYNPRGLCKQNENIIKIFCNMLIKKLKNKTV